MEMLEAIGNHLIDVTKFLRMISATPPEQEMEPFDMPDKTPSSSRYSKATMTSKKLSSNSLRSIKEEEPQVVNSLSENVADFSLDRIPTK